MSSDNTIIAALQARLETAFASLRAQMPEASAAHVARYLNHGEPEMACESLVLSLIEDGISVPDATRAELLALAEALGLRDESVFRADFWQHAWTFLAAPR